MSNGDKHPRRFTFVSFLLRLMAALLVVLLTYNPSGFSYFHWVQEAMAAGSFGPEHFIAGVLVVIGWAIFIYASHQALGPLGVVLMVALLAGVVWLLFDMGILEADSVSAVTWIVMICVAALLAVGVSWSHLWKQFTGQYKVDDVDD